MESKKICRILILLFALLSVFFFALYSREHTKITTLSDDFINETVKNLKTNGVDIDKSTIKTKTPLLDIYTVSFDDVENHNKLISDCIMQNAFSTPVATTKFDVPDGYSVGIYDEKDASRELGKVVFSDTDKTFRFSLTDVTINSSEPVYNGDAAEIGDSSKALVEKIARSLNKNSDIQYEISGYNSYEDTEYVTVIQKIDEYEIYGAYINFIFVENKLVAATGKWITTEPKREYHDSLVDGINVLYKLDLDNVSAILEEKLIYSYKSTENDNYYLVPGWEITYIDNNDNLLVSRFDAL